MQAANRAPLVRVSYDCMKNGVEFRIVTLAGVIIETSLIAKKCIGHDLVWLKQELKKGETYSAVKLDNEIPFWLQDKEFAFDGEGKLIIDEKLRSQFKNRVVIDTDKIKTANIESFGIPKLIISTNEPLVLLENQKTKLPNLKGVKFI